MSEPFASLVSWILGGALALSLGAGGAFDASAQSRQALVGGTVVDPASGTTTEDAVVLVEDGMITAVGPRGSVDVPAGATRVDVSGRYVMPGLVDGHVHFFQSGGLYTRPDAVDLRSVRPYAEERRRIQARLPDTFRRYLRSGVTSVVDVGGPMWNLDVRAQADTTAAAPRVVVAGPLLSSVARPSLSEGDPPILKIESPDAARAEVRRQVEAGVDLVKIWYIVGGGEGPEAFRPIAEATVDEAHRLDMRVAVHATQLETARAAVEIGADVLVHSVSDVPVDAAFVDRVRDNGVLYTPTLMVSERYSETFRQQLDFTVAEHRLGQKDVIASLFDLRTLPDSTIPPRLRQAIRSTRPVPSDTVAMRNLKRLHDAGVTVVAGTDAGNIGTLHGPSIVREFELMEAAGLTPREVLATATVGGAALLGRDDLGRVAPGYRADLVVLRANPLDDLHHVTDVEHVMRGGTILHRDALEARMPEDAVQQQLNAYNAGDLDGFVDAFADSVAVYDGDGTRQMDGIDAVRTRYGRLFDAAPTLHAELLNRIVLGRTVIDHERVTGLPGVSGAVEVVALYTVDADGQIARVEFRRE